MSRARVLGLVGTAAIAVALAGCSEASSAGDRVRPLANDCSGGYVAFTFDDGPGPVTTEVADQLVALDLEATFFVLGEKVETAEGAEIVRDLAARGFSIQSHTYDHASMTGATTGTAALTEQQITEELERTKQAIVEAGLPAPTLYRPPYGDVSSYADLVARRLGYRLVMPWGAPDANILDSDDWSGSSPEEIAERVIHGYTYDGERYRGLRDGTIVAMHDAEGQASRNAAAALQPIVDHMNDAKLCSTAEIREDATGGQVPIAPPRPPEKGNLVSNGDLERVSRTVPTCFQQSDLDGEAIWKTVTDAKSGRVAQRVEVDEAGDHKMVLSQRASESSCLAPVEAGQHYRLWASYRGSWPHTGESSSTVSLVTFYRTKDGEWVYWETSPSLPPSTSWTHAFHETSPLPEDATALSFGLSLRGKGSLTVDDYVMVAG
ncbi:polysaccharide deacetylase family protein [Nocardioides caldifontis]|uniref:polysaccharide deacetylase family protein n=1 Tax=Nocardioides caldifontis TaxID=2588938 RepID=UPI0013969BA8|nr:polysaccharide deacetylase family protein [Nocardioides caldifontis]